MLFSVEQAFVGREEIRAPLKMPAWEARWNPTLGQYQPCEGMTEEQIALPTLQDKTAIVGTREEDQAIYPTLEALFKRK